MNFYSLLVIVAAISSTSARPPFPDLLAPLRSIFGGRGPPPPPSNSAAASPTQSSPSGGGGGGDTHGSPYSSSGPENGGYHSERPHYHPHGPPHHHGPPAHGFGGYHHQSSPHSGSISESPSGPSSSHRPRRPPLPFSRSPFGIFGSSGPSRPRPVRQHGHSPYNSPSGYSGYESGPPRGESEYSGGYRGGFGGGRPSYSDGPSGDDGFYDDVPEFALAGRPRGGGGGGGRPNFGGARRPAQYSPSSGGGGRPGYDAEPGYRPGKFPSSSGGYKPGYPPSLGDGYSSSSQYSPASRPPFYRGSSSGGRSPYSDDFEPVGPRGPRNPVAAPISGPSGGSPYNQPSSSPAFDDVYYSFRGGSDAGSPGSNKNENDNSVDSGFEFPPFGASQSSPDSGRGFSSSPYVRGGSDNSYEVGPTGSPYESSSSSPSGFDSPFEPSSGSRPYGDGPSKSPYHESSPSSYGGSPYDSPQEHSSPFKTHEQSPTAVVPTVHRGVRRRKPHRRNNQIGGGSSSMSFNNNGNHHEPSESTYSAAATSDGIHYGRPMLMSASNATPRRKQIIRMRKIKSSQNDSMLEPMGVSASGKEPLIDEPVTLQSPKDPNYIHPMRRMEGPDGTIIEPRASASGGNHGGGFSENRSGDRILYHMAGHQGPKSYRFGYDTGKGRNRMFRYEEKDGNGYVKGKYGFYDKHGKLQVIKYQAHPKHGYHAEKGH